MANKTIKYATGKDGYISSYTVTKTKKNGTVKTKTGAVKNKQREKDIKASEKKEKAIATASKKADRVINRNNSEKRIARAKSRVSSGKASMKDKAIEYKTREYKTQSSPALKDTNENFPKLGNTAKDKLSKLAKENDDLRIRRVARREQEKKTAAAKKREPEKEYGYDYYGATKQRGAGSKMEEGKAIVGSDMPTHAAKFNPREVTIGIEGRAAQRAEARKKAEAAKREALKKDAIDTLKNKKKQVLSKAAELFSRAGSNGYYKKGGQKCKKKLRRK